MATAQTWQITGTIDGVNIGVFDTYSGGGVESEIAVHRSGGMGELKTYPALPTYGDVTIGRTFERERDLELHRRLSTRVGRAEAVVSMQLLDDNGSPAGAPLIRRGRLMGQTDPEADSNGTDPSMFELSFKVSGVA